jgi:hypothetical protein
MPSGIGVVNNGNVIPKTILSIRLCQDMMDRTQETQPWEELYRYWLDRHVDGHPPTRAQIDPMIDLHHLASNLIVIDIRPDGSEYRLIGSQVVSHFGVDATGKPVGATSVDPIQVNAWRAAIEVTAREQMPRLLVSHYPRAEKTKTIAVLLPLAPDADGVVKIFAATFFGGPFPNIGAYKGLTVSYVVMGA